MLFKDELKAIGCNLSVDEAEEEIQSIFHALFRNTWNEEQLLFRPRQALLFGEAVCHRWNVPRTDEIIEIILRRLTNMRKSR